MSEGNNSSEKDKFLTEKIDGLQTKLNKHERDNEEVYNYIYQEVPTLKELNERLGNIETKIIQHNDARIMQSSIYKKNVDSAINTILTIVNDIETAIKKLQERIENNDISGEQLNELKVKLSNIISGISIKLDLLDAKVEKKSLEQSKYISEKSKNKVTDLTTQINTKLIDLLKVINTLNQPKSPSGNTTQTTGGRRTTRKIGKKLRRTLTKAKKTLRKLKAKAKKVKKAKKQTYTQKGGYIWPFKQDKGKKGKGKGKNKKTTSKTKRSRLSIF